MEKINQEVFKSGTKIFLTEKECLMYEKLLFNNKHSQDIIAFLLSEEYKQEVELGIKKLYKKDLHFTTYEFKFISDTLYLNKYDIKNELMSYSVNKPSETIKLWLCDLETFKVFYLNMLKVND